MSDLVERQGRAPVVAKSASIVVRPSRPQIVARDMRPLIEVRGWVTHGNNHYTGFYLKGTSRYQGAIRYEYDEWNVQIKNPPRYLKSGHEKSCCMSDDGYGWWSLHLHTEPLDNDVSSIIAYVERLLSECT